MAWRVQLAPKAERQLAKLDPPVARRLLAFLRDRVAGADDPRALGAALTGPQRSFWRYRVGDYRIVCRIDEATVTVLVLAVAHRREVYR